MTTTQLLVDNGIYSGSLQYDLRARRRRTGKPCVIMLYGGQWTSGNKENMATYAQRIAEDRGWLTFAIDYTIGNGSWPANYNDTVAAVNYVIANGASLGIDPTRIAMWGLSSGAHLSLLTLIRNNFTANVKACAAMSPPTDLVSTSPSLPTNLLEAYIGATRAEDPQAYIDASPITYTPSAATMPPVFMANATVEVIPLVHTQAFAAALTAGGVTNQLAVLDTGHASALLDQVIPGTDTTVWRASLAFLDTYIGALT
jgi:acetyl esterase/lipase